MHKELTIVCHSHKVLDEEFLRLINPMHNSYCIKIIDLAKEKISLQVLLEMTSKLDGWEFILVDTKFLDHSINNPEKEFLMLDPPGKVDFLYNNQWTIGTPIAIDDHAAVRFMNVDEASSWLKTENVLLEEFF